MPPAKTYLICSLIFTMGSSAFAQDLVINEVMSSNNLTILDEDGDSPDWLELYNAGDTPIDLTGIAIADSSTLAERWSLPAMHLEAGEHLLIFASGKDRRDPSLNWETVIDWGDDWSYLVPDETTPANWYTSQFDAGEWSQGPSGFGYGDNDDSTEIESTSSVFIRKEFTVNDPFTVEQILFHIDYDDAFVAYINGTEIARENITSNGPPPYDQFADDYNHEAQLYQQGVPRVFALSEINNLLIAGTNVIAVQVHNANATSSDLTAIPFLTFGSSSPVSGTLSEHLTTGANHLHTNFKIDADGEHLMLFNSSGELIDSVHTRSLPTDISYGRRPDGSDSWLYFSESTPGSDNLTDGFLKLSGEVTFSVESGLYDEAVEVVLSTGSGGDIYFTTDGSLPESDAGELYTVPITVSSTTVLRAQAFEAGSIPGPIATHSYLINTEHSLAVISLSTHPDNFWDFENGIYVMGATASGAYPHFGANFWEDWERPIHIEMFDENGDLAFSQDAGVKIFGGWSRGNAQKSLSIFARKSYGKDHIDDKIFDQLELDEFSNLVLRNSGNDWNITMFRDALLTSLFHKSVDKQACRPAVIYINGAYWGIQNIREKVNEDFLANHHDLDPDNITILEANAVPVEGDEQEYLDLIGFVNDNDLSIEENFNYVAERIDMENFIYYQIGNIFIDNRDWPGNNIKYWKSNRAGSKWRWITYDTDFGFDLWNEGKVTGNTLAFALDANAPDWPNPPWSTLLLRKLVENENFRNRFINTFADELNSTFIPENVINKINDFEETIASEIDAHMSRWNVGSYTTWQSNVNRMRNFAEDRPEIMRDNIRSVFSLSGRSNLTLEVNDAAFGNIRINTLYLTGYPWSGEYFGGVPVTIKALPKPGYSFLRWEGDLVSVTSLTEVEITSNMTIRAIFEESDNESNSIVINEINYNSDKDSETEDWVELYNKGAGTMDLSGWVLKDDDDNHAFVFENGTTLDGGEFLVICRDMEVFGTVHTTSSIIGNMGFGLSSDGDCVRLFNDDGTLMDEVCFLPNAPWPTVADGKGGTLALKDPALDNSDPESWYGLGNNGNPGESNKVDLEVLSAPIQSSSFSIYPNPVNNRKIQVSFALQAAQDISLEIYNLTGKKLGTLFKGRIDSGSKELELPDRLEPGVYLIVIRGDAFASKKLIIR